jgi:uncharacterized protein YcnI
MLRHLIIGAVGAIVSIPASAHVTLETKQARVGASYKAVLRVPHGCDGSATTAIRVRVPDGFVEVKPMPKPGWSLQIVRGRYHKPFTLRGATISEGATEVSWSGGKLPDAFYDEFVFIGAIADNLEAGEAMYFKVVQECEKGIHRWIDIPDAGQAQGGGDSEPAAALKLLPKR